jgi:hypothetical protein
VTAGPLRSALFLGCKRSDDFLEARLAAEQAPLGQEIQLSVVNNPEPERPVAFSVCSQASSFSPIQAVARAKYSIYRGGFLVSAVRDYRSAGLPAKERTLLDYVWKLSRTPGDMTEADIDGLRAEGWTDPQIVATVHVTGIFAYMNRVAEAFGLTPIPPPKSGRAGERERIVTRLTIERAGR